MKKLQLRIEALETRLAALELTGSMPRIVALSTVPAAAMDICPGGGTHDYPLAWWGTVPPQCSKCGKPAESVSPTFTISSSSLHVGDAP